MMFTRLQLLTSSIQNNTKALTVAIRYGIVRTQFKNFKDPTTGKLVERKILDYQTHLHRICPLLAFNFAMVFGANLMYANYFQMMSHIE